jgi:hypothetical protein
MHKRWNRIGAMNAARDRRAATGGKIYKQGRVRSHRPVPPKGSWERLVGAVQAGWQSDTANAINEYERAVWPERYEEFI